MRKNTLLTKNKSDHYVGDSHIDYNESLVVLSKRRNYKMDGWMQILLALITGVITGGIFTLLKLPLPAPPALPGIAGIVGIFIGFKAVSYILTLF